MQEKNALAPKIIQLARPCTSSKCRFSSSAKKLGVAVCLSLVLMAGRKGKEGRRVLLPQFSQNSSALSYMLQREGESEDTSARCYLGLQKCPVGRSFLLRVARRTSSTLPRHSEIGRISAAHWVMASGSPVRVPTQLVARVPLVAAIFISCRRPGAPKSSPGGSNWLAFPVNIR